MYSEQFGTLPTSFPIPYGEDTGKRSFGQFCRKVRNTVLSSMAYSSHIKSFRIRCHRWRGVHIGEHVYIGIHCTLDNLYPELIYLEDGVTVNADSMILTHFNPYKAYSGVLEASASPVLVKRYSIVSVRSTLMPGVSVGKFSIVAAASVVCNDVGDRTIVRGNPAVKVGRVPGIVER